MKIKVLSNQLESVQGIRPEYPYVCHHANYREMQVPWHWHDEFEFDYILQGELKVMTTERQYLFHENEAFFTNSNILCCMEDAGSATHCIADSHLFDPVFLGGHFKSIFETKYVDPVIKNRKIDLVEIRGNNARQKKMLAKLRQVSALQKEENTEFQTRNIFSELWLLLLEEIQEIEKEQMPAKHYGQERIQSMMSYIHENYAQKLTLDQIAAAASISRSECLRTFQTCIEQTPFEYLINCRIDAAKKLLSSTDDSILDIALQTGFSNSAYFGKLFKKATEKTPGAFRKQC